MQDPPRGTYYPAGGIGAMQQPRQYQYSATNPWQREEREKVIKSCRVIYCTSRNFSIKNRFLNMFLKD